MIARVKSTQSHIIDNPISVHPNSKIRDIKNLQKKHNICTVLVTEGQIEK
jgi:hypothetical protein